MRKISVDRLLAGAKLSLIATTPILSIAAPDRIESAVPLPPSLNGQPLRQREAALVPPPPAGYTPPAAIAPERRA